MAVKIWLSGEYGTGLSDLGAINEEQFFLSAIYKCSSEEHNWTNWAGRNPYMYSVFTSL
jgi:hypothetical protein